MTGTSAVPQPTLGPLGFIVPAESAILTGVLSDTNAAFGGAMNTDLTTPQGVQASSQTAIIADKNDQFLALVNGIDPSYATGRMQDGICRLYFLTRFPATATLVACTLGGAVGTFIPVGSFARDTAGNIYASTAGATIGAGSTVSVTFANISTGPIPCPAGSLTQIYATRSGWNTITNPADGVLGENVETAQQFEARRKASVAGNSAGQIGSIIGAVAAVTGVEDYYGYDNGTGAPVVLGGVTVATSTIYICVLGGADNDVGQAIWSKKGGGCGYTGNTTVTAYDNNPLYSSPIPYSVTFERPTATPILFAVEIANTPAVPSGYATLVQNAIINAFSGGDGGPAARIGSTLYASRWYSPIAALGPWAQIVSVLIGTSTANLNELTLNVNQNPTITSGNISVSLV